MKRRNTAYENSGPQEERQAEKRRCHTVEGSAGSWSGLTLAGLGGRADSGCPALVPPGASSSLPGQRRWTCAAKWNAGDVGVELLEGMGVNIIEDASNDSMDLPSKPFNLNLVLKSKDQNILETPSLSSCSPGRFTHTQDKFTLVTDTTLPDNFLVYSRGRREQPRNLRCRQVDTFNRMSDEVVLHVFRWLPKGSLARCSLVSKRWNRLAKDDSLWKRVDLGLRSIHPGVVGQVLSRGCLVLRLARSSVSAPIFLSPLSPTPTFSSSQAAKLQYLDLSMTTVEKECLENLLFACRNLKKLALERCDISDKVCEGISRNPNLEVLHMALCTGVSSVGVGLLTSNCVKLTELNLSWTDLSAAGLTVFSEKASVGLERLCLAGYREELQDSHVARLVVRCRSLRELDLSDSTKITARSVSSIVENLVRLESLSTSRCYAITPSTYLLLVRCPTLLYLNVYGLLRDAALTELRDRLRGIEINKHPLSSVARPTIGIKRTSIWNLRVRD